MLDGVGNYGFMVAQAKKLAPAADSKILDFGCGRGQLVALGSAHGLDMAGADAFDGNYKRWSATVEPAMRDRILQIVDGKLPFADDTFDVVISNMVFEHIREPLPALLEINRVLKPGGQFLACFPTCDVWFEGHAGIYFPHFLRGSPTWQLRYLAAARRLGFGYYGAKKSAEVWASDMQRTLRDVVFYHEWRDIARWWREAFGSAPVSMAAEYIAYRAEQHPRLAVIARSARAGALRPLVEFVCHRRAGRVVLATKAV